MVDTDDIAMKFLLALSRRIGLLRGGIFYVNKALKDDKKIVGQTLTKPTGRWNAPLAIL